MMTLLKVEKMKMPEDQKGNRVFIKHNKKRNTGLLFEFLTRFVAGATMFGPDNEDPNLYLEMMIRYFDPSTELGKELSVVRSLAERRYSSKELAARAIYEFKDKIASINHEQSNIEKSNLIKEINYSIGMDLYSIDVPNYRLHTSIYGLCEAVKKRNYAAESQYEELVLENLTAADSAPSGETVLSESEHSDAVVAIMVKKLNERFDNYRVNKDQRAVLQNYVAVQQGDLSEEAYRSFIDLRFEEIRENLKAMSSDRRLAEPQVRERLERLHEIFASPSEIDSIDDITSIVVEGLTFAGSK